MWNQLHPWHKLSSQLRSLKLAILSFSSDWYWQSLCKPQLRFAVQSNWSHPKEEELQTQKRGKNKSRGANKRTKTREWISWQVNWLEINGVELICWPQCCYSGHKERYRQPLKEWQSRVMATPNKQGWLERLARSVVRLCRTDSSTKSKWQPVRYWPLIELRDWTHDSLWLRWMRELLLSCRLGEKKNE